MNKIIPALIIFLSLAQPAFAQEHDHGKRGIPDWYEPSCCHQLDCRPVENDKDIVFETFEGHMVARHVPTGIRFYRHQFRQSQDERYHVCIHTTTQAALCFYDRPGA